MRRRLCFVTVLALLVASRGVAIGAPFTVGRSSFAGACLGNITGGRVGDCAIGGAFDSKVDPAPAQGVGVSLVEGQISGLGDSLEYWARATSLYGILAAGASAAYDIKGSPTNAFAVATATFTDIITISSNELDGTAGHLTVLYTLSGVSGASGTGVSGAVVSLCTGQETFPNCQQQSNAHQTTAALFSFAQPVQFIFGQPFGFQFGLQACAGTFRVPCSFVVNGGVGSGTALANFANTLILSGLIPTDVNGASVPDAVFSSVSGTQYDINGVRVPEPTSLSLLLIGAAVFGAKQKRR